MNAHMSANPAYETSKSVTDNEKLRKAIFGVISNTLPANEARRESEESFTTAYRADPMERVSLVKEGVPADFVQVLANRMEMPQRQLVLTLGLASATISRKSRGRRPLSPDDSSKVLGMARLVGQVQTMVDESGLSEEFDAATWVAQWLDKPLPALAGRRPAELMDTPEGQSLVSNLVARFQTGAYA